MLKSTICKKTAVSHMTRTIFDPSCLRYCADFCGVRCKNRCNKEHGECSRGRLPEEFLFCPSPLNEPDNLGFITYESRDVDTFGKGTPYKRVEKIFTDYSYTESKMMVREEFERYAEHTLSYWFLRATKIEAFKPSERRATTATITSDFGEAIQIVGKREVSSQFFHRPEVIHCTIFWWILILFLQVCLFGSVTEITVPKDDGTYKHHSVSHIITSDYK